MSATVLKAVNSAYFGHDQKIKTVSRAVAFLGLETLSSMVLGNAVFRAFEVAEIPGFDLRRLWGHSFQVATVARHLAQPDGFFAEVNAEDAYVSGVLHDIGQLVFASEQAEGLAQAIRHSQDSQIPQAQAEADCIGVSHAEVGAYLISLWGFAMPVVEAVAWHEMKDVALPGLAAVLHIAERLSEAAPGTELADAGLNAALMAQPELAEKWPEWLVWRHECEAVGG